MNFPGESERCERWGESDTSDLLAEQQVPSMKGGASYSLMVTKSAKGRLHWILLCYFMDQSVWGEEKFLESIKLMEELNNTYLKIEEYLRSLVKWSITRCPGGWSPNWRTSPLSSRGELNGSFYSEKWAGCWDNPRTCTGRLRYFYHLEFRIYIALKIV